jgi:hypothetical protein
MNEDFSKSHHEPIRLCEDEPMAQGDARAFREGRAMRKAGLPFARRGREGSMMHRGWKFQHRFGSGNAALPLKGARV